MKIMIDPGHAPGNTNKGKNGYFEHAGMWKLSNYLHAALKRCGLQADLTRDEHQDPSLTTRGAKAQGYDLFISEHSNESTGTARGVEVYYSVQIPANKVYAAAISKAEAALMKNNDRGAKTRESTNSKTDDYYTVIYSARNVGCPHVFLAENGFHDNVDDEAFLMKDENLKRLAEIQAEIICGILNVGYIKDREKSVMNAIMGQSEINAGQLATYLLQKNPEPKINCTAYDLAVFFIEEGNAEGVRGDIAFCQSIHETGWFKYGGQVLPEQNNYCGLGAVNNSPVGKGAWFDIPRLGVRAQMQHLKAYASTEPLNNPCIDPRFNLVTRGCSPCFEDLNNRWAVPGEGYGQSIVKLFETSKSIKPEYGLIGIPEKPEHWAEKDYQYLIQHGIVIHEKRFDDPPTRGEIFSLLAQVYR